MTTALDELFASNPADKIYYLTLELSHSAFSPVAHRLVQGYSDLVATLEAGAPIDAGQQVTFAKSAFKLKLPEKNTKGRQDMSVTLYGAALEVVEQLERQRVANREPVKLRFREFQSGDLTAPASKAIEMTVLAPRVNKGVVSFGASFADVINKSFPSINYTVKTHPGLI
ncbi:MAG: DUF1833 domain-containing protein [Cycloclasticus sp.]|nr:DUF1833 domain-containing protein [Cycloclasticus sp.]